MNCDEARDLAPLFALDMLADADREAVAAHLRDCGERHEEFEEFRAVALAIAAEAPEREPPVDLRARLLGDVVHPPQVPGAPDAGTDSRNRRGGAWRRWPLAAAAALALVVVGVGVAGWQVLGDDGATAAYVTDLRGDGWEIRLEVSDHTRIRLGGLPPKPGPEVYQVWLIRGDGSPVSIGVIGADVPGPWSTDSEHTVQPGDIIAVTIEPEGGMPAPTTDPILAEEAT